MAMTDWTGSPYYSTAVNAANQYGVPADLFTWQIGVESSYNPNAVGSFLPNARPGFQQAQGIAQFMPGTAADYGVDAMDPADALQGAARYMRDLYDQTGDWMSALNKYGTLSGPNGSQLRDEASQILNNGSDQGSWWDQFTRGFSKGLNADGGPFGPLSDTPSNSTLALSNFLPSISGVLEFAKSGVVIIIGIILITLATIVIIRNAS